MTRLRATLAVCLLAVTGTAVVIAVRVPLAMRRALAAYATAHRHSVSLDAIRLNPLTLSVDLDNLRFVDAAGHTDLDLASARLELSAATLWQHGTVLRLLQLHLRSVRLDHATDGHWPLVELLPASDPASPWPALAGGPIDLLVDHLAVHDAGRTPALDWTAHALHLHALRVNTTATHSDWTLQVAADDGATLQLQAALQWQPLALDAAVAVHGLQLDHAAAWLAYPVTVHGDAELAAQVHWRAADSAAVRLDHGQIDIRALELDLPGRLGAVSAARLTADPVQFDSPSGGVSAGAIRVESPQVHLAARPADLLAAAAQPAGGVTTRPLRFTSLTLQQGRVEWDAQPGVVTPPRLQAIDLALGDDHDGERALKIALHVGSDADDDGAVQVDGTVARDYSHVSAQLQAQRLALPALAATVQSYVPVRVDHGVLSTRGRLDWVGQQGHYRGNVSIDELRTTDPDLSRDFLGVDHLEASGLDLQWPQAAVQVASIDAESPYADVRIARDGQSNMASLVAPRPLSEAGTTAYPVRIDRINIRHGRLFFADESQTPQFEAGMADLAGEITALSSDPSSRAHLAFTGHVDRYAPAAIDGEANLLAAPLAADIHLHFDNLELTGLSPYSGRFAGYTIRKGKANADLTYHVQNHHVDANHHVRLQQFELGERVPGRAGFGVPLGFVIALLKDRDGNIDLDVPLSGSLDDPAVHIGDIAERALGNLLRKVATAPFSAIGALFGHGEELADVSFSAGDSALSLAAKTRLASLAAALVAHPALSLDVPIATTAEDAAALAQNRWRSEVLARLRDAVGDADDAALLQRFAADPLLRRRVCLAALGQPDDPATELSALESAVRARTAPTADDLALLATTRAEAVQAALVEGTGVEPSRIFLVRTAAVHGHGDTVALQLALR